MYSPKIKPEQVRELYLLKQINKKPMTKMVRDAVTDYIKKNKETNDVADIIRNSSSNFADNCRE